jgi:cytochrome c peroxidase
MSEQEKIGAIHFFETAECGNCHNGPALNSMAFFGYGMLDLNDNDLPIIMRNDNASENKGRGGFTGNPTDNYKFKVPQLYNLMSSTHYGHGASFHSIRDVVEYKNLGVKENMDVPEGQLAPDFQPLGLTEKQVDAITAFLSSGLYDAELQRYVPFSIPSGNCFPNNDPASRQDLGCD